MPIALLVVAERRCGMLWFGQGHLSPAWNERVTVDLVAVITALFNLIRYFAAGPIRLAGNIYNVKLLEEMQKRHKEIRDTTTGHARTV
jgi:hypothetical protein